MMKKVFFLSASLLFLLMTPSAFAVGEQCSSGDASCCTAPPIMQKVGGCPFGRVWIGDNSGRCEFPSYRPASSCSNPSAVFLCSTNTCYVNSAPACSTSNVNTGSSQPCCLDGQFAVRQGSAWICADTPPPLGAIDGTNDANEIASNAEIASYVTGLGYITNDSSVDNNELTGNGILPFEWVDSEVSDTLTIGASSTVDIGALPVGSLASPSTTTVATTQDIIDQGYGTGSGGGDGLWTTSGSHIYSSNSGNVGIGTTNPTAKLDVVTTGANGGINVSATNSTAGIFSWGGDIGVQGRGNLTGVDGFSVVAGSTGVAGSGVDYGVTGTGNIGVEGSSTYLGGNFIDSDSGTSGAIGYGLYGGYFTGDGYFSGNVGIGTAVQTGIGAKVLGNDVGVSGMGGSYGVEGFGDTAGAYFKQLDPAVGNTSHAYLSINGYGIEASGDGGGGFFRDADLSSYSLVGVNGYGIRSYGNIAGGYFIDTSTNSNARLAFNDYGGYFKGNGIGVSAEGVQGPGIDGYGSVGVVGRGKTTGPTSGGIGVSGTGAYNGVIGRGTGASGIGVAGTGGAEGEGGNFKGYIGISAVGDFRGGHFAPSSGSSYANVGDGNYGINAWGTAAGGWFQDIQDGGNAQVGVGTYGVKAKGNIGIDASGSNSGGYFTDSDGTAQAYVASGNYGIDAYGDNTGVRGTGASGIGVSGDGYIGVSGNGSDTGGYFEDIDDGTSAHLAYGKYGGSFSGDGYFSGNVGIGTDSSPTYGLYVNGGTITGIRGEGTTYGVRGFSNNIGVAGSATNVGVYGLGATTGVWGASANGDGVYGSSTNGAGVRGYGTNTYGVYGSGSSGGGYFVDSNNSGYGYVGFGDTGVRGVGAYGIFGYGSVVGVHGSNSSTGSFGQLAYDNYGGYFYGDGYFSGDLGIGTNNPSYQLDIESSFGYVGIEVGNANYAHFRTDRPHFYFNKGIITDGGALSSYNQDLVIRADYNASASADQLYLETTGDVGIGGSPSFKLDVQEETTTTVMRILNPNSTASADGLRIQLGASTPGSGNDFMYFLNGSGSSMGSIDGDGGGGIRFNQTSDARLKADITDFTGALDTLMEVKPRHYKFKANLEQENIGFIAQELQEVYPYAVSGSPDSDPATDPMGVDYSQLTPLLAGAIQELKAEKDAEIDALKAEIAELKKSLEN